MVHNGLNLHMPFKSSETPKLGVQVVNSHQCYNALKNNLLAIGTI